MFFRKAKPLPTLDPRSIPDEPAPNFLEYDLFINKITGRPVMHFECQIFSDTHASSIFFRAKKFSRVMRDFISNHLFLNGDIYGGDEATQQDKTDIPDFHRQCYAQIVEKAQPGFGNAYEGWNRNHTDVTVTLGNHEALSRRYWDKAKKIWGIIFTKEAIYTAANGDVILVKHGDDYDLNLIKTNRYVKKLSEILGVEAHLEADQVDPKDAPPAKETLSRKLLKGIGIAGLLKGTGLLEAQNIVNGLFGIALYFIEKVDLYIQDHLPGNLPKPIKKVLENCSITRFFKHHFKTSINETMGILDVIEQDIIRRPDIKKLAYGHSHIPGIHAVRGAYIKHGRMHVTDEKVLMNSGSSTGQFPQGLIIDKKGSEAWGEYHRDHLAITMANGFQYQLHYATLLQTAFPEQVRANPKFANSFSEDAEMQENKFMKMADQIFARLYHIFPARDRAKLPERLHETGDLVNRLAAILGIDNDVKRGVYVPPVQGRIDLDDKEACDSIASLPLADAEYKAAMTESKTLSSLYWRQHLERSKFAELEILRRENPFAQHQKKETAKIELAA